MRAHRDLFHIFFSWGIVRDVVPPIIADHLTLNSSAFLIGMIGEVARGEVDAALQTFGLTSDRSVAVDFSVPIQRTGIGILLK